MRIEPLSRVIGAEVLGVDLGALAEAEAATLRRVWLEHHVLVVRGQDLSEDQLIERLETLLKRCYESRDFHREHDIARLLPVNAGAIDAKIVVD